MAAQPYSVSHDSFLNVFRFGGLIAVATDHPAETQTSYYAQGEDIPILPDRDVFFGPAMRSSRGATKSDILGSTVLWVDADDPQKPLCTIPPSAVVASGRGYHLYWFLTDPLLDIAVIEKLNKLLVEDIPTADKGAWNVNRVLRVPGTTNHKYDPPAQVLLQSFRADLRYGVADIEILSRLDSKTRHKIRTGDSRGYRSRSERDWAIVTKLIQAGATDSMIHRIFENQPCGDKCGENTHYLDQTLEKAHTVSASDSDGSATVPLSQDSEGYYKQDKRGIHRLSTFVIAPKVLLDGSKFSAEDAIVCDVTASGYTWQGKVFSRGAFTSVHKFDTEAPVAAWQWLGRDEDIRRLLPHLLEQLRIAGLPKVSATSVLGLHNVHDEWVFLGNNQVLTATETFEGYDGPICWLPSQKEHPVLELGLSITPEQVSWLGKTLPMLNEPETIWPMIGWYSAACLKPWLELNHYRFPILNVAGTKGSGKCVPAGSLIRLANGQDVPIETITKRTEVVAWKDQFVSRYCTPVQAMGNKPCYEITLFSGRVLTVSADHPILTSRGWVEAKDLTNEYVVTQGHSEGVSRKLLDPTVYYDRVVGLKEVGMQPVFNIEVEDAHTFLVGGVVTHNTTIIQRVFLKLFGQTDPKTYDAGTTKFVTLALLGSTNAVPIAFSEFRYEFVEKLLRTVLLAYDTGHDPRGRGDQTTVDYPLSAPFSVDGEDLITDPAARERIIVAHLHPDTIAEGSDAYRTFQSFRDKLPAGFAGYYFREILKMLPQMPEMLAAARESIFKAFPKSLPDRIRNNHVVAYLGILLWCRVTGSDIPDPSVLLQSIKSVYNMEAGRATTLADTMIEDIVNTVAQGTTYFNVAYRPDEGTLWFQLTPAHSWWVAFRRRSGRGALERDAIKAQLKEAPYSVPPQAINDSWMYGIDLAKAAEAGLDIPTRINDRVFIVRF